MKRSDIIGDINPALKFVTRGDEMGRVNRVTAELLKGSRHWVTYGAWLELQRGMTRLTQTQVAEAVGISSRQWKRYIKGAPVPLKRIPTIAKVLGVPVGRAMVRAGHEPRGLGVDVDTYLRRIRDWVFEGEMKEALLSLYEFYYDVAKEKKRYKPEAPPLTANNFIVAAVAIDRMPSWLRREFVGYLLTIDRGGGKVNFTPPPAIRNEVRALIKKELRKAMLIGGRISLNEYRSKQGGQE